jgi:hypothetical protein
MNVTMSSTRQPTASSPNSLDKQRTVPVRPPCHQSQYSAASPSQCGGLAQGTRAHSRDEVRQNTECRLTKFGYDGCGSNLSRPRHGGLDVGDADASARIPDPAR